MHLLFFSSRRRHTRYWRDWSSDVCSSDLDRCVRACDDIQGNDVIGRSGKGYATRIAFDLNDPMGESSCVSCGECVAACPTDRKSTRLNSSHANISYAVFCLKKKTQQQTHR